MKIEANLKKKRNLTTILLYKTLNLIADSVSNKVKRRRHLSSVKGT